MKRRFLIIILSAIMLAQCKKDSNEAPAAPDMVSGLLANFEMTKKRL
jgi:hypothetical protein